MLLMILLATATGYSAILLLIASQQRRLIFRPDTSAAVPYLAVSGPGRQLDLRIDDGITLQCWFVPAAAPDMPMILYLHGNAGHLGHRAHRVAQFARLGWGVLLLGYRGYGGNPGAPSERALVADAGRALEQLGGLRADRQPVFLWGESLGTGIAVQVAAAAGPKVDGMVLEAPYTAITDIARRILPWPLRPALLLLRHRFDSLAAIARVRCPVFVLAGRRDTVVPPNLTERLFARANDPKAILWLDAGHADLGGPAALDAAAAFLLAQRTAPA